MSDEDIPNALLTRAKRYKKDTGVSLNAQKRLFWDEGLRSKGY